MQQVSSTTQHYRGASIALHWIMLALMIAVYACIELKGFYPKGSDIREGLKTWHFMLGLSVLSLALIRLYFKFNSVAPPIVPAPTKLQAAAASVGHALLYVLMIALPIGGWLMLSAAGKPIPFFGLTLPPLLSENKELAKTIKEIHETAGTLGYYLIGLHALAALFHHYVLKDNTLMRMMPKR
ncbi:MAG TPA: cytochrome b [Methylophilus sp.]